MTDFFKKFLLEDPRRFSPSGRFVALAAFGKHPGWDDHVEDLGLETESLNLAKTTLYVNGIGGQIDSGAWEKLDPAQQFPAFQHVFVWQRSGQILLGRLWSSSDGKGRKRYPMVVCVHFMGVSLGWALKQGLPVLADLEQGCVNATSAEEVRSLLSRKRAALREALQSTDGKGEYAPVTPDALHRILSPSAAPNPEGFKRVLYQIHSQFAGFAPGTFSLRANPAAVRVQQIRVPAAAQTPEQALLFWTRFFLVYVDASVPLLLALPLDADWIDITAGEPESHEMFCLRANPKAVPLVSEVPYKLEEDFRSKAGAFLEAFQRGETTRPNLESAPASIPAGAAPAKGGFLKWLGFGLILLLGAAAAVWFVQHSSHSTAPLNASQAKPVSAGAGTKPQGPGSPSGTGEISQAAAEKSRMQHDAEVARLAEEKKNADAVAAAEKLKAETEVAAKEQERRLVEAAAREKQRQLAEAAAKENEKQLAQAAAQEKERLAAAAARLETDKQAALQEQQRKAAEIAAAPAQPLAKTELIAASVPSADSTKPGVLSASANVSAAREMTNSIGMVLVQLPSGLWVGKFEVTQAEYKRVMNTNPSHTNWLGDLQPVQQVTWLEAVDFTRKLNELERATLPAGAAYSLPTEKQWQDFAGGQKIEDVPGATLIRKGPSPVGRSGPANKFGLYDVLGNLWEWCLDDAPGDQKILKGGAFNSNNYDRTLSPDVKSVSCGFRCILAPPENR